MNKSRIARRNHPDVEKGNERRANLRRLEDGDEPGGQTEGNGCRATVRVGAVAAPTVILRPDDSGQGPATPRPKRGRKGNSGGGGTSPASVAECTTRARRRCEEQS